MQIYSHKPLSISWLKAAVVGSLWASFEIVVGSFLHNLKVPFSGTFLTFSSVFLVIAFIQVWQDRGLVWRAGLVCALMKSLSPSAVILGPMIGIFTEALIIELVVRILGRNLVAYVLAGALAVASALFHKVISLLILYGFNLVNIAEGLYQYAVRQLRITNAEPLVLLMVIVGIYFIAGAGAAVLGYFAGKKYRRGALTGFKPCQGDFSSQNQLFTFSSPQKHSLPLLFGHLAAMITALWMLNQGNPYLSIPLCMLYIAVCLTWYRKSLRYLRKPGFWIQFTLITLAAAFLLEGYSSGQYFSYDGLIIGLKMNLRAFLIMTSFSAISTELKNPLIRSLLYDRGMANLYQSLSLAFSALPGIIAGMPGPRTLFRQHRSFLDYIFNTSQSLLAWFEHEHSRKPDVFIFTGEVGAGKTTFIESFIGRLTESGYTVSGFTAPGIFKDGAKTGFRLRDLRSGNEYTLSTKEQQESWNRHGHYYFDPKIISLGREILLRAREEKPSAVVIDEIGPMEIGGQGWAPAVEALCRETSVTQLWVVRKPLVSKTTRKWNVGNIYVFDIAKDSLEDALQQFIQNHSKKG